MHTLASIEKFAVRGRAVDKMSGVLSMNDSS
jgi:hypothetical protein